MGRWRVHTGFTVGRGSIGEEEGGGGWVADSCWLHRRLRLCRRDGGRRGGGFMLVSL